MKYESAAGLKRAVAILKPMNPEVRFQRIETLLHAMAERENQMEIRFNKRMEQFEQRMTRSEERMTRSEEKFDRQIAGINKLIVHGMKMIAKQSQEMSALKAEQKAFLAWWRRGDGNGNGNGHR